MIFNYCIWGEVIDGYTGAITCTYYDNTITEIVSKTVTVENNFYQFHLGDYDMLGLNYNLKEGSSVILTIADVYYSNIIIDTSVSIYRYDIDVLTVAPPTTTVANADVETVRVVSDKLQINELDNNLYSYFKVTNGTDTVHVSNGNSMNWIPTENGIYYILQRAYNTSLNTVSEITVTVDILENYIETTSVDYIFYSKKGKVIQIELPDYVTGTLLLEPDWYYENNKLIGKNNNFKSIEMLYSRGKVIIKSQVGDIIDY